MTPAAIEIAIIAVLVSVISAIINKKVVDQKRMKEIKKTVSDFQKKYNEAKKNNDKEVLEKMEKEQKDVMNLSMELMKGSFKPMLYTFVPIILVIFVMSGTYGPLENVVEVPVIGLLNWFWWYFLVAIIAGISFEILYRVATREKK